MFRRSIAITLGCVALSAAAEPISRVDNAVVSRESLEAVLVKAYGLDVLLKLQQLELAKADARALGATVSPADIVEERKLTLRQMFPTLVEGDGQDSESLLAQILEQQKISPAEFDVTIETNAYLRAIVRPVVEPKLTDDVLREAFNVIHGERVRVRHIALANLQEVAEAQRRLAAGEDFASVARAMSRSPRSASRGGELDPFARQTAGIGREFSDAAFALQPGQVSDPVYFEGLFHLLKLEERIAPRAVKFEDVRESVRERVKESLESQAMSRLRQEYSARIVRNMRIEDPELRKQLQERIDAERNRQATQGAGIDRADLLERIRAIRDASESSTPQSSP